MNLKQPSVSLFAVWLLLTFSCARTPEPLPAELLQRMSANVDLAFSCSIVEDARWQMNMGPTEGVELVDLEIKGAVVAQDAGEFCSVESQFHSYSVEPEHRLSWHGSDVEHFVHQDIYSNNQAWTCSLYGAGKRSRDPFSIGSDGGWSLAGQALALLQGMGAKECVVDGDECQFLWTEIPKDIKESLIGSLSSRWKSEDLREMRLHVDLQSGLLSFLALDFGDGGHLKIQIKDYELLKKDYQNRVEAMVAAFEVNKYYRCECGDIPGNPPLPSTQP